MSVLVLVVVTHEFGSFQVMYMQPSEVLHLFPGVWGVATCSTVFPVVLFAPLTAGSQANWMFFLLPGSVSDMHSPGFVLGGGGKGVAVGCGSLKAAFALRFVICHCESSFSFSNLCFFATCFPRATSFRLYFPQIL